MQIKTITKRSNSDITRAAKAMALAIRTKNRAHGHHWTASQIEAILAQDGFTLVGEQIRAIGERLKRGCIIVLAESDGVIVGVAHCERERDCLNEIETFLLNPGIESELESALDPANNPSCLLRTLPLETSTIGGQNEPDNPTKLRDIQAKAILETLEANGMRREKAASILGMSTDALLYQIKARGLQPAVQELEKANDKTVDDAQRGELEIALKKANGNKTAAAKALGIAVGGLYRRMKRLGVR